MFVYFLSSPLALAQRFDTVIFHCLAKATALTNPSNEHLIPIAKTTNIEIILRFSSKTITICIKKSKILLFSATD